MLGLRAPEALLRSWTFTLEAGLRSTDLGFRVYRVLGLELSGSGDLGFRDEGA